MPVSAYKVSELSTTAWPPANKHTTCLTSERTQIYTLIAKGPEFCNKSKI